MTIEEARTYLFRQCNSFTTLPALLTFAQREDLSPDDWLVLLGEFWTCCDNVGELAPQLAQSPLAAAISDPPAYRQRLMDGTELQALNRLPDEIAVWRGCYAGNQAGLSWSLNRETAARFPYLHRYKQPGQPLLVEASAPKRSIVMLKLDREEAEVVLWARPKHVSTKRLRRVIVADARQPAD